MTKDANPALSASASITIYQLITLDIASNNAQSGDRIALSLRGRNGARVAWSTGQEFSTASGIRLSAAGPDAVPISGLSVSDEVIALTLAPGVAGGNSHFTLQIFLAATSDISQFTLTMSSDARSAVSAALPMNQPKSLSGSPTIFDWREH